MIPTVILSHLDTGYGSKTVTRDINATLYGGELTCLLGPNGAGKSTLLKTLCGFLPPVGGDVTIAGKRLRSYGSQALAREVGVVLTSRPQAVNMTVAELVSMGRSPYTGFFGALGAADRRIVAESMQRVGIASLASRSVMTLSDGERQKTMIAKALAQQTPIIYLDEPTAYLDYPSKVEILGLLSEIAHDAGKTVFMSTHDLELALQMADKVWLLDREHGLNIGIPEDLAYQGLLARYFESPALRFDAEQGAFVVSHPTVGTVSVTGAGTLYRMTLNALRRAGYEVTADAPVHIDLCGDVITVGDIRCHDISGLLAALERRQ